ncbi:MAG: hypothetical protein H6926_09580 [Chromatiales bacterium]|nr:hypothetical protein [Chromatiales bacterium]
MPTYIIKPSRDEDFASTIRAAPRLEPDERDRLANDLARQCQQCTHDQEKPCP